MKTGFVGRLAALTVAIGGVVPCGPTLAAPGTDDGCDHTKKPDGSCLTTPAQAPRQKKLRGPTRPAFSEVQELDYASLPLMKPRRLISGGEESFSIRAIDMPADVTPYGPPGEHLFFLAPDANLRVGSMALVPDEYLPFRGYKHQPVEGAAEWFVVDRSQTSARHATLRRYEGVFANESAKATRVDEVHATALVLGELYAFRRCVAGCPKDAAEETRKEEVGIVAPRAVWSAATDALTDPSGELHVAGYTVRTAPIARGLSAALEVVLDDDPTAKIPHLRAVDVEVVWAEDADPALTLYVGSDRAAKADVVPGYR